MAASIRTLFGGELVRFCMTRTNKIPFRNCLHVRNVSFLPSSDFDISRCNKIGRKRVKLLPTCSTTGRYLLRNMSLPLNPVARMCSTSQRCWNCNSERSSDEFNKMPYFCSICKEIQPVEEDISHFQRLDCENRFDLDVEELQKHFRLLQSKLHPDKFSRRPERVQSFSAQQSSAVNKAYRTLLHPLSRGLYMLELAGHAVEEGDSNIEPTFLMEIMEINEKLSELDDLTAVKQIGDKNEEKLHELMKDLAVEFENRNFEKAREILMRLKYYANVDDKVKQKLGTSIV
ncbi:Iron-sulfur cluster co-chaperone protein HscB, mitochondrial [Holothuria leucospilota]|uniref:Iron-sulfur cluster co-chaperone protein HscB, mitochondrial n=1 Tax=Holothuria leucospilota TaxID=206669 RepID=A0A9Q1CF52_HOLLE|nr:Iron-sulfur cluster co-chaperone protein HscB, mitochondrial [Holothuria leucospilota]